MPVPTTRDQFKDYCLRKLGAPVIQINLDDDQCEDRIDDALQMYWDYHYDAWQRIYSVHKITQTDINNRYFVIDQSIIGISRIFPVSDSNASINMFDLRYQLRLNELYDFTSASYVNFTLTMQHLRTLELLFTGLTPIRFNRHQSRLYVDWNWGSEVKIDQQVVAECSQVVDPENFPDVWNDRWLKAYATVLICQQWGSNLRKFDTVLLPGGATLNGEKIYLDASKERKMLEDQLQEEFAYPPEFIMG